ncbi:MAG: hypothetical protein NVS1B7_6720 [Candidatus Saccharimonadales bacterium]
MILELDAALADQTLAEDTESSASQAKISNYVTLACGIVGCRTSCYINYDERLQYTKNWTADYQSCQKQFYDSSEGQQLLGKVTAARAQN